MIPLWKTGNDITTHYTYHFGVFFSLHKKALFCVIRPSVFRLVLNAQDPPFHRSEDKSNNTKCTLFFLHLAVVIMKEKNHKNKNKPPPKKTKTKPKQTRKKNPTKNPLRFVKDEDSHILERHKGVHPKMSSHTSPSFQLSATCFHCYWLNYLIVPAEQYKKNMEYSRGKNQSHNNNTCSSTVRGQEVTGTCKPLQRNMEAIAILASQNKIIPKRTIGESTI